MVAEVARRRTCPAGYDEGLLRTYLDGELAADWHESVTAHVQGCPACTERLTQLRLAGALVQGRLQLLDPVAAGADAGAVGPRPPVAAVLARARQQPGRRERLAAWWRAYAPALRPAPLAAGLAGAAVLLFGAALTQPAVQGFAQGVLQQFRVQKVQPVQIDPVVLQNLRPATKQAIETLFRSGTYTGPTEPQVRVANSAQASQATGVALRGIGTLPSAVQGEPTILVSDPVSFTYTYDGQRLVEAARQAGVGDAALLAQLQELHGVTVRGNIPAAAAVIYGSPFLQATPGPSGTRVAGAKAALSPFLALVQLKSPSIEVPPDVDVNRLRAQALQAGVQSGAIPPEVASQLLAITDLNTLPLPVLRGTSSQVTVDGVTGTLVASEAGYPVLTWQKDGVFYILAGSQVTAADLERAARSLARLS
jgi:hypothetical protein